MTRIEEILEKARWRKEHICEIRKERSAKRILYMRALRRLVYG